MASVCEIDCQTRLNSHRCGRSSAHKNVVSDKPVASKSVRAELLRNEVIARHADTLSHFLYPNRALQEREVAGISFVARYGPQLLADLYRQIIPIVMTTR